MPNVTDYKVLRDSAFTLNVNQERTLNSFSLPGGLADDPAILSFMIDPSNNASNLKLEVEVNDQRVYSITASGTSLRTILEPFSVNSLNQNGSNTVQFRVDSGTAGSVRIDNVIIWFQRRV
ncbi:hypothetical protein [Lyngbya sp. PCC 8106]|uniref:hypothetical protein n=1 Tax=Lyngbya sp. (strain PCC 8106) TaxID=313612 RepID=UPI0000EAA150|nr:hypothetical protein [Lyngbya sp. PCC 8106]EAW38161.1 hypothetical protein L8106_25040 [Lyngbya sp. PCC 8106]